MSGPGDIGGEVSGDEAAWRDLIARFDSPADPATAQPWPASEDLPGSGAASADEAPSDEQGSAEPDRHSPAEGTRIIRYAADPRSYTPPEEDDEDERYVPAPLPPPARMDALSKAAWVALIVGPGYLLLGTLLQWTISGTEALVAIAAFIAGFVILVLKMGERPPRDKDDDGAVL